ncbi:MAG: hypothetical protein H0T51_00740 [Pirellulales bacterium]|nr:hypothetical protein [Pirellulales bacterium]
MVAVVTACAIIGGAYAYFNRSPLVKLFGGVSNMRVVRHPTRVEAYLLGDPPGGSPPEHYVSPLDYPVTAGPIVVPSNSVGIISEALLANDTYGWEWDKACGPPVYGVKLSFYQAKDRLDVYLCFQCDVLTTARDGQVFGSEDFDNARHVLVKALKQVFPNDKVIEELSEQRLGIIGVR